MTHQEIIKQIIAFPVSEQFEIIEEIQRNIKENFQLQSKKSNLSNEEKLAIVESLGGSLKMTNPPMDRDEEKSFVEDYLTEKHR